MTLSALDLLRALHARAVADGRPGPAGLVGDWLGADAVIAPSIAITPGTALPDRPDAFWFGALPFPAPPDSPSVADSTLVADSPSVAEPSSVAECRPRNEGGVSRPRPPTTTTVVGGLTDGILELRGGAWSWRSATGRPCPDWVAEVLAAHDDPPHPGPWRTSWTAPQSDPHLQAIAACREAIADGEVYQACICTRFTGTLDGAPIDFFADVAAATTPAKAAFLHGDWGSVASFSPESFLRRSGGTVTSSPIKGTLPSGADPVALSNSAKDVAENVMIVDLVRNDLGRVARTGSVRVPDLLTVVGAPGVWHLVSTVAADLDHTVGNDALIDAAFPPASVTGTPKIRAAELIAEWEQFPRGFYCGAVGVAGPSTGPGSTGVELDLNVAIRTVAVDPDGSLVLGVGGGITYDSDPAAEWQECLDKAAAIVSRTRSGD
ncbi:aminodeoxychorismate synthase component I [Gordonia sp. VNK21]|uniref:aminodeoxychorismate synthase component I n=1 Tax=Gordonia sp. VNK21 TaxID=3382483 RepID=UPI0038D3A3C8